MSKEAVLIEKYLQRTKISRKLYARACKVFPGGCTRMTVFHSPYPSYIVRGEGCKIYDADGNEYIDYTNNYGPLILGHKHPKVMHAITKQLECGTVLGGPTKMEIKLAEKIIDSFSSAEQVLFCSSGTEANMIGLRAIRAYTGKDKILKCKGAYHGTSDSFVEGAGVPQDVTERTITIPFNDLEGFETAIKDHKDELAAVFMEPIMRGIPPQTNYLKNVRKITENNNVLLVFDEVVTGFRLSRGGAQEKWGIKPDMTLLGKIIGGGLPLGAVLTSKDIMGAFKASKIMGLGWNRPTIPHGGTYNGHPVAMAAGIATLDELTSNCYNHLDELGKTLKDGIAEAATRTGIKIQVVGEGSIFHVYFTDQPVIDAATAKTSNVFLQSFYELYLIIKGIYPAKSHCSFLSTPTSSLEVNKSLNSIEEVFSQLKPLIEDIAPNLLL